MNKLEQARLDPRSIYDAPEAVLNDAEISVEDKIEILKRWAYDEKLLETADGENMPGIKERSSDRLQHIHQALLTLGIDVTASSS